MGPAARVAGRNRPAALWILAGVLGLGLVAVTFNTIRLQILTQREEIEVSKLIGATDAFIRRPFYYLGLLQGLAGGRSALAIVFAALALLNREVQVLAQSYGSAFRFAFLPLGDALAVVGFAGLLGWLGAQLSVSRHFTPSSRIASPRRTAVEAAQSNPDSSCNFYIASGFSSCERTLRVLARVGLGIPALSTLISRLLKCAQGGMDTWKRRCH